MMKFKKTVACAVVFATITSSMFNTYADETQLSEIEILSEEHSPEEATLEEIPEISDDISLDDTAIFQDIPSQEDEEHKEANTNSEISPMQENDSEDVSENVSAKAVLLSEGSGTKEDPYKITTAKDLDAIRNDLSAHYVLTADIDLFTYDNWVPLGTFSPLGTSGEDAETPDPSLAFTGSFDGAGHTISNLTINSEGGMAFGLFGCTNGAEIKNVTIKDAKITGSIMTGSLVGYIYDSSITDAALTGNSVIKTTESPIGAQMVGGLAGAGMQRAA